MSILGILDAMRSDLPAGTRLVWACLENHANGERWWPITVNAIAEELHLSRPTVLGALATLEGNGTIRREIRLRQATIVHMLRCYDRQTERSEAPPEAVEVQSENLTVEPEVESEILTTSSESGNLTEPPGMQSEKFTVTGSLWSENLTDDRSSFFTTSIQQKESTSKKESTSLRSAPNDDDFDEFWSRYPRKVGKAAARKAWAKACKKTPAAVILSGVDVAPFSADPRFRPHPATWLNGERWLDEPDPVPEPRNPFIGIIREEGIGVPRRSNPVLDFLERHDAH